MSRELYIFVHHQNFKSMKSLSRLFIVIAAICLAQGATAQLRTSYFMEGTYFRTDLNPALAPTRGYVALPGMSGVGVDIPNNFLSAENFLFQKEGQSLLALHPNVASNEFLAKLPDKGRIGANANVNILSFGFYTGRTYWNIGTRMRSTTDVTLSKDIFAALKTTGSGTYDLSSTAINSNSYLETYLGTSFPIGKHVNIGIRAKFLVGVLNMRTQFESAYVAVAPDNVAAQLRGSLVANGIVIDQSRMMPGTMVNDDNILDMIVYDDPAYLFKNAKSYGGAIDLGVEVKMLRDHLKLSVAVTDVGFINWKASTNYTAAATADIALNSLTIDEGKVDMEAGFEMVTEAPSAKDYRTELNGALNVGIEYNFLRNHFAIGLMSHTERYDKNLYTELTASLNIRATNWLSATVSHTFLANNKVGVLGAAINIHPRALNIFVGADFVDTRYVTHGGITMPRYMNSINVYAGVGFNFARPAFIKKAEREAKEARKLKRQARW